MMGWALLPPGLDGHSQMLVIPQGKSQEDFFPFVFSFLPPPSEQKQNFQSLGSRGSNDTLSALEIRRDEGTYTNTV